jgi:ribosomal protein L34E
MNNFYAITTVSFIDDVFAYSEPYDAHYGDDCPRCPECGAWIGSSFWLEPRKVELSRPKYGDFVSGVAFLVSESFKEAYEKSALNGIKQFIPVEVSKVRHMRKNPPKPPQYYSIEIVHSFARIDLKNTVLTGQRDDRYCALCNPLSCTKDKIDGLYIDDSGWGGEDIFHLHELGGNVFASQRFVDFCLEHRFTNFNYVDTRDYKFGYFD